MTGKINLRAGGKAILNTGGNCQLNDGQDSCCCGDPPSGDWFNFNQCTCDFCLIEEMSMNRDDLPPNFQIGDVVFWNGCCYPAVSVSETPLYEINDTIDGEFDSCQECCDDPGCWYVLKLCDCEGGEEVPLLFAQCPICPDPPCFFKYEGQCYETQGTTDSLPNGAIVITFGTTYESCAICCGLGFCPFPEGMLHCADRYTASVNGLQGTYCRPFSTCIPEGGECCDVSSNLQSGVEDVGGNHLVYSTDCEDRSCDCESRVCTQTVSGGTCCEGCWGANGCPGCGQQPHMNVGITCQRNPDKWRASWGISEGCWTGSGGLFCSGAYEKTVSSDSECPEGFYTLVGASSCQWPGSMSVG